VHERATAREHALQFLYQLDLMGFEKLEVMQAFLDRSEMSEVLREFARSLILGVHENWPRLDEEIRLAAKNWDLQRMAVIDRNILRLGIYELLFCEDIPPKVVINEAVELGKRFSTEQTGGFVNGILDSIVKKENIPYDRGGGRS